MSNPGWADWAAVESDMPALRHHLVTPASCDVSPGCRGRVSARGMVRGLHRGAGEARAAAASGMEGSCE